MDANELSDVVFERVLRMDSEETFWFFLTEVSMSEELWTLERADGDGFHTSLAEDGDSVSRTVFPVWTHRRLAEACAHDRWAGGQPASVDPDSFIEFLDELEENGDAVALHPHPEDGRYSLVEPSILKSHLSARLADEREDDDGWDEGSEQRLEALARGGDRDAASELSRLKNSVGKHDEAGHWARFAAKP